MEPHPLTPSPKGEGESEARGAVAREYHRGFVITGLRYYDKLMGLMGLMGLMDLMDCGDWRQRPGVSRKRNKIGL